MGLSHTHLQKGLIHGGETGVQLTHWQGLGCVAVTNSSWEPHAGFPCGKGKGREASSGDRMGQPPQLGILVGPLVPGTHALGS